MSVEKKWVIELTPPQEETQFLVIPEKLTIGRTSGDLCFEDSQLGDKHCTFRCDQEMVSIFDHGSERGSYINGVKIHPAKMIFLKSGDEVFLAEEIKIKVLQQEQEQEQEDVEEGQELQELEGEEEENINFDELRPMDYKKTSWPDKLKSHAKRIFSSVNFSLPIGKKKVKIKKPPVMEAVGVSAPLRMIALMMDFLLVGIIYHVLNGQFPDLILMVKDLYASVEKYLWKAQFQMDPNAAAAISFVLEIIKDIFPYLFFYILLGIISHLLLAVSLGQFLIGIRVEDEHEDSNGQGKKLTLKLKSLIRFILGVLTAPFLLFDLPCVKQRKTFKEVVSGTSIFMKNKWGRYLGLFAFFPLLIALFLISPLISEKELIEGLYFQPVSRPKKIISINDNANGEENFVEEIDLPFFNFKWQGELSERLIGRYSFITAMNLQHSTLVLKAFDLQKKGSMEMRVIHHISLDSILKTSFADNPTASLFFPYIHQYLNLNGANKQLSQQEKQLLQMELEKILTSSLHLGIAHLQDYLSDLGPFLNTPVKIKKLLLESARAQDKNKEFIFEYWNIIPLGNQKFLQLSFTDLSKKKLKKVFLPITFNRSMNWAVELVVDDQNQFKFLSDGELQALFKKAQWSSGSSIPRGSGDEGMNEGQELEKKEGEPYAIELYSKILQFQAQGDLQQTKDKEAEQLLLLQELSQLFLNNPMQAEEDLKIKLNKEINHFAHYLKKIKLSENFKQYLREAENQEDKTMTEMTEELLSPPL